MNVKLTGTFTLLSPLSHIGETISTTAYLVQEPVPQPDGSLAEIFCYSGNAWRGQLRDLSAAYLLDYLGGARVSQDLFHLLFSGGKIGGDQVVDIPRAMTVRNAIPHLAIFGGGLGNQIMAGKLKVGNCYPICREMSHLLPAASAGSPSYKQMTFEKSFSRKDDSRDQRFQPHLVEMSVESPGTEDGPADQMRMTVELLAAGSRLHTTIHALDVSEADQGCLLAAIQRFGRAPFIGGQSNRGHGQAALSYDLVDLDSGDRFPNIVTVDVDGITSITKRGQILIAAYNDHLREKKEELCHPDSGQLIIKLV
ncbi:MAG: hypothetical protein P1P81_09225 [Desulfobulbales bacterium]|nr:hypothetical protein [Desulfobulbales bacterium]